jgi:hypothetical protein
MSSAGKQLLRELRKARRSVDMGGDLSVLELLTLVLITGKPGLDPGALS